MAVSARVPEVVATLVGLPVYNCNNCGDMAVGSSTVKVDLYLNMDYGVEVPINHALRGFSNTHMPYGWAGYGLYRHLCPKCKV